MTTPARFSQEFRRHFPGTVTHHFDKYVRFTNPVPFDPFMDIYRTAYRDIEWDALQLLRNSPHKGDILQRGSTVTLLVAGNRGDQSYRRDHINFSIRGGYANLSVELDDLPVDKREKVEPWARRVLAFKRLERHLHRRIAKLLDCQWDPKKGWDGTRGCYRGGPSPGIGCNTPGQVHRMWPDLFPYLPPEYRDTVRDLKVQPRLPNEIIGYGTPEEFMCLTPKKTENLNGTTTTEPIEQFNHRKRMLAALNHILVQMTLLKDVPAIDDYPDVNANARS